VHLGKVRMAVGQERLQYAIEMASGSMMYVPDFIMISSGIQVILRSLTQQFERLQCWYYRWVGVEKYTIDVGSHTMIYAKFHK
jgi:uncharacterized RmlC-like cupin family protein